MVNIVYGLTAPQKLIYSMEIFAGGAIAVVCGSAIRNGHQDTVKLKSTVNALYRLNDALRTRIVEQNGEIKQTVVDFTEQDIEELYFANKAELDEYAENYAKQPININGNLCEVKIVQLPEQYGFIIKVHHIIGDAWTLSLFASQFYAILDGETPVAYPYKEYADSEVAYLQSKRYEKDSAFFLAQFNKCDEVTYLSDKQTNSLISVRKTFEMNREKSRYIYNYAQEHHTSPFTLFATALSIYMNRVKMNAEKFYIGTAVLNRSGVREKNTMGMFINTVPMLIELNNEQTFLQNLKSVEASAFSALRHQKYNYGDVLEDIRKKYNFNERLYDVIISYQNAKITGNAESTWYHNGLQVESLQIHIDDRDSDGFFKFQYDYQIEKFTEQDIERLHQNICNLLFDAIFNDDKKLYELELLTSYERKKLLFDFNNTTVNYPIDKCIHTLFEEQVMKTPDKTAVIACDRTLTYDELNKQANRIAHRLIVRNIGRGDIVAIKLTRKSYIVSAMFGVIKTAAAYMPLDPTYPQERIEYMLHESNAKYVIDEENIFELLDSKNDNNPNIYVSFDDIFCALHTSGSTGEPKLSLLLHGGICNYIVSSQGFYKNADTFVSSTITTFDAFQWESVLSISKGITLVLSSEDAIYNQTNFEKLFSHSNRNMFFCPPAKLENYINNSIDIKFLSNIKSFIIGGEVFIDTLLEKIRTHSPDSTIFNAYGPTETTVICIKREVHEKGEETTLGKPIANTQIYIIDKYLKPVPIGVTGELCIAGDGVGAGYLNRPELTAEKFIDNPFGKGKLYRTGDLAYWRDDGNIVYVGRNDFQVKIRGLRIELGEIENAISAIDGILQSVVIVRKDNTGRQIICAFYTGKEFPAKEIREIIGQKLPKYMLPHIFTHLDEMPLTSSGKISRKSLPDIDLSQIIATNEYVKPENELEIKLSALMEKVLEYSPIGMDDDFFEIGCDSLKAIMFTSIAHNDGINFNLQNVFDYPTIRLLAEYINDENKQQISYANFDFTDINKILAKNTIERIQTPQVTPVGNILLCGATGFLGSHILSDYLEYDSGIAYCLVRGKNQAESEKRLAETLKFYFGEKYNDCKRIHVICADLQEERLGLSEQEYEDLLPCVDTVINAAATVKHYGSYSYFHSVNVEAVTQLIDFCVSSDAKLIHISTESVSGIDSIENFVKNDNVRSKIFYASDLYIGQNLENVYALSKFEAEIAVLQAMSKGLRANIMRMGNLTNRYSDGVFQINYETNAFLKRFKAFLSLGMIPDYLLGRYVEFTPIDEAAHAVMTITRHFSNEQTVFHLENYKRLLLEDLIVILKKIGYEVTSVEGAVFTKALLQTIKQKEIKYIFEAFINDMDANNRLAFSNLHIDTDFTVQYLKRLGFEWSEINLEYLKKYMEYFKKKGYWKR